MSDTSTLDELDESACFELLSVSRVGRVAFAGVTGVQIIPVNFVLVGHSICFRTADDSILAVLAHGVQDVAFEVDHVDALYQSAWSVCVQGATGEPTAQTLAALRSMRRPLRTWAPGPRDVVVELTPRSVTGRRVRA